MDLVQAVGVAVALLIFASLVASGAIASVVSRRRAVDDAIALIARDPRATKGAAGVDVTIDGHRFTLAPSLARTVVAVRVARHDVRAPAGLVFSLVDRQRGVGVHVHRAPPTEDPALVAAWRDHGLGDALRTACADLVVTALSFDERGTLAIEVVPDGIAELDEVKAVIARLEDLAVAFERVATALDARLLTVTAGVEVPRGSAAASGAPVAVPVRRER